MLRQARHCGGCRFKCALALAVLAITSGLEAAAELAYVGTRDQWVIASQSSPEDIVITAHLDLTGVYGSPDPTGQSGRNQRYANKLLVPGRGLRSIRGDCPADAALPAASSQRSAVHSRGALRDRQCIILAPLDMFFFYQNAPHNVWLDNLFLRFAKLDSRVAPPTMIFWQPPSAPDARQSQLWVTDVDIDCDMQQARALYAQENGTIYVSNGSVRNCISQNPAFVIGLPISLESFAFDGNEVDGGVAGALQLGSDASARLEGVTFSSTAGQPGNDIYLGARAAAYVADSNPSAVIDGYSWAGGGDLEALADAPGSQTFPSGNDGAFTEIQQAAAQAARNTPQPAPAPVPADGSNNGSNDDAAQGSSHGSGGASAGLIAGVVCAAVVAVTIAALVALLVWRRRRSAAATKRHSSKRSSGLTTAPSMAHVSEDKSVPLSSSRERLAPSPAGASQGSACTGPPVQPPESNRYGTACATQGSGAAASRAQLPARSSYVPAAHASRGSALDLLPTQLTINTDFAASAFATNVINTAEVQMSQGKKAALEAALDNLAAQRPRGLLAGRFEVMRGRVHGGQALVQMARDYPEGESQYAIKFFNQLSDYRRESALYDDEVLATTLPPKHFHCDNTDRAITSPSGYAYPPFMVLERGVPLAEWLHTQRSPVAILNMFYDVAKQLTRVHSSGVVHRDLKPGNVLFMLDSQVWKLIDFGIAAQAGLQVPPACSPAYACPEVMLAYKQGKQIVADPAQDIWALGVIVYAAITDTTGVQFKDQHEVLACAQGLQQYPWEQRPIISAAFARSRVRDPVLQCLSRDAADRPGAEELAQAIDRISNSTQPCLPE